MFSSIDSTYIPNPFDAAHFGMIDMRNLVTAETSHSHETTFATDGKEHMSYVNKPINIWNKHDKSIEISEIKEQNRELKKQLSDYEEQFSEYDKTITNLKAEIHHFRKFEPLLGWIERYVKNQGAII
jgi:FtsZ-binding cell division protein ZapB